MKFPEEVKKTDHSGTSSDIFYFRAFSSVKSCEGFFAVYWGAQSSNEKCRNAGIFCSVLTPITQPLYISSFNIFAKWQPENDIPINQDRGELFALAKTIPVYKHALHHTRAKERGYVEYALWT